MDLQERTNAMDRPGDCVHGVPMRAHCTTCVWETDGLDERLMPDLQAENQQLRRERAALLEACEALVAEAGDVFAESDYGDIYCVLCGEDQLTNERVHDPDCPIEKARRAIAMVKRGEEA